MKYSESDSGKQRYSNTAVRLHYNLYGKPYEKALLEPFWPRIRARNERACVYARALTRAPTAGFIG